jgi:hypothetical protein
MEVAEDNEAVSVVDSGVSLTTCLNNLPTNNLQIHQPNPDNDDWYAHQPNPDNDDDSYECSDGVDSDDSDGETTCVASNLKTASNLDDSHHKAAREAKGTTKCNCTGIRY